jgi:signal transduction histidine kinase
VVVLDRTSMMDQVYREAWNRILIFALGTLLLIAAGAVWQFTVKLAQAEGTTRVLQAETRHLRELGQAAAGLAHETRNPLGLIRGWTQRLVKAGLPSDDQQEQAEAVLEECDRVTARINQFLAFARQAEVNTGSVSVGELVQELKTCCSQSWRPPA